LEGNGLLKIAELIIFGKIAQIPMKLTLFAQIPTSGLEYWQFFNFYITARNIVKILKSGSDKGLH